MARLLTTEEITRQLTDLPGWARLGKSLHARFEAPRFPAAVELVSAVAEVAEQLDHHPDMDIRWRKVRFELSTHSAGGVTQLDIELAHRISAAAGQVGASSTGPAPSRAEIAIDAEDAGALVPFWRAGLGYRDAEMDDGTPSLRDPTGLGPVVWFQNMDPPRTERNRLHVDVYVPPSLAERRVADVVAAGGRLVTGEFAPRWWVLADAEGNELCVCVDD